jgi:hypothetical protein
VVREKQDQGEEEGGKDEEGQPGLFALHWG